MTPRTFPVVATPGLTVRRLLALSVMLIAGPIAPVLAADHLEAPGVMGRGDVDLNDIYIFQSPTNPNNSVLTLTVNPFAGQISGTDFSDAASYQFLIDNDGDAVADITYSTTFSAPVAGVQSLTTTREAGGISAAYAMGQTGQNITTADTGILRAGLFDDPFFFDLNGFVNGFNFTGDDAFAGANVSAIVLELPSAELGGPAIGLWAATVDAGGQVDRMGRPAINTALIPVGQKDAFNLGDPVDDAAVFSDEVMASLLALSADAALANALTGVLLPDILTFDTSSSAGFLNGRQLSDDVIDAVLNLVSGGGVTTDLVDANDVRITIDNRSAAFGVPVAAGFADANRALSHTVFWCWCLVSVVLMLSPTVSVAASSYLPVNDEEVLETLPRSLVSGRDELTRLRQMLSNDPGNAKLSARLAERYLDLGRQGNDPRFFGYARAVIGKWWNDSDAPPAILRLRAKLKEKDHRYRQALADLLRLLQSRPDDIQALIELANIYRVQGRYPESKKTCDALATVAGPLPTQVCLIPLLAVTGRAHTAYAMATEIVSESSREQLRIRQWALTMTAVIAQALGQTVRAEHHYREALVSDPTDTYLLRGFADFLLDQERTNEVVPLLRAHTGDNGVLLRAAIAARRIGQIELARRWQSQLETRFAEIRLRGALTHRRFESRYALELKGDPQRALTLALLNWERQKETRDSRNVLAAAIALADPAASRAVRDFLAHHGTQDITLQQLIP